MNRSNNVLSTLLLLIAGHFAVDFMLCIWPIFKTMAHLDLKKAGLIAGVCAITGEGLQIFFGAACDKGYARALTLIGVLAAAANMLLPYTNNYTTIFILLLLTYIGSGAFHPAAVTVLNQLPTHQKGTVMSLFTAGGGLGQAISPLIFSTAYLALNQNIGLLLIPMGILFIIMKAHPLTNGQPIYDHKSKLTFGIFRQFFSNKNLSFLYFYQLSMQILYWSVVFLLPDILVQRNCPSWLCYGGGNLFFSLGCMVMMIPSGWLADRYSCKIVLYAASVVGTGALYLFLLNPMLNQSILIPLLFILGGSLGLTLPVAISFGNKIWPDHPGVIAAFLMGLVWCFAESIGPICSGYLASIFTNDGAAIAMGFIGVMGIVAISTANRLPDDEYTFPIPCDASIKASL